MSYYSNYINKKFTFAELTAERKKWLKQISTLRNDRDIFVFASDFTNEVSNISTAIDYGDKLPVYDQIEQMSGKEIDIILETPGGQAEVVEDLVSYIRDKYEKVGIIIPGWAKSAGTIFAMAGDEILMGKTSAMGPIDAQIVQKNKRYSAEAFLEGLDKIKAEVIKTGRLNPAYIPILQNISPGEIEHCNNAQNFSQKLVTNWLSEYKFKFWDKHSTTGKEVSEKEKEDRAKEIAKLLCKQSKWLTHGRSIKIADFKEMKLQITDFSANKDLNEAIMRYHTLLRMTFDTTNIYKLFETTNTQIYRHIVPRVVPSGKQESVDKAIVDFKCSKCNGVSRIQCNLKDGIPLEVDCLPYPLENDIFTCPQCKTTHNLKGMRIQLESQVGKQIVK